MFIQIYGSLGDSGRVTLEEKGAFKKNGKDEFELELIDVGDITKIRLGHDGAGLGSGWFVNKVVVRNMTSGEDVTLFDCVLFFSLIFYFFKKTIEILLDW